MTHGEQLCYTDAYARSVEARVAHVEIGEAPLIVLDRTVFYPGGGGQPSDRGLLLRSADGDHLDGFAIGAQSDVHRMNH